MTDEEFEKLKVGDKVFVVFDRMVERGEVFAIKKNVQLQEPLVDVTFKRCGKGFVINTCLLEYVFRSEIDAHARLGEILDAQIGAAVEQKDNIAKKVEKLREEEKKKRVKNEGEYDAGDEIWHCDLYGVISRGTVTGISADRYIEFTLEDGEKFFTHKDGFKHARTREELVRRNIENEWPDFWVVFNSGLVFMQSSTSLTFDARDSKFSYCDDINGIYFNSKQAVSQAKKLVKR